MEVSSVAGGIMASRESSSFNLGLQKGPAHTPPPAMQSMRLAYTADGTAIYKPVSSSPPAQPHAYQGGGGGVAGDSGSAAVATHGVNINMGEPGKRKRGRPRKYGPDGLALNPSSTAASAASTASGAFSFTGNTKSAPSDCADGTKKRGRPPGSGKKHKMSDLGSTGSGFTPHVITVMAGEDVSSKIISFSQHGSRAVCVMSANGAVSNATLRQPAASGGIVTYEGRFEILSLSGSFLLSESDGQRSRTGGLSVSLSGPDGRVLGGGVAGLLLAASPVQVIVGSFVPDGRKESKQIDPADPISALGAKLTPFGTAGANSPPSRGTLSGSSGGGGGGGGPGSPVNPSPGVRNNSSAHHQGSLSNIQWN